MSLTFFAGENTDDLDELFDTLARSATEFLAWLQVAADRLPEEERLGFACGVATTLWGFLGNGGFDDEILEEANDRVVEGMRAQFPREREEVRPWRRRIGRSTRPSPNLQRFRSGSSSSARARSSRP
jgi:hypothetical protein